MERPENPAFDENSPEGLEILVREEQIAAWERALERLKAIAKLSHIVDMQNRINNIEGEILELRNQITIIYNNACGINTEPQEPFENLMFDFPDIENENIQSENSAIEIISENIQPELDFLEEIERDKESQAIVSRDKDRGKLLPARYANQDFFVADIFGYSLKDDAATMEAPVFSLKTQKDFSIWEWSSKDDSKHIEVSPSAKYGRATQHDKDVLIFVTSQMTEALNRGRPDVQNRAIRFTVHNYLVATNKPTGGAEYLRLETALDRLKGTTIKTTIRTGDKRVKEAFGIIDSWTILERAPNDERMIAVEIVISKWLYNAIQAHEVLTLHPDYFRLRKPLERRLYELARKHCGAQSAWKIGLELLREKCGAQSHLRAFRNQIQEIANADTLPEYRMTYNSHTDQITFYLKNGKKLLAALATGRSPLNK